MRKFVLSLVLLFFVGVQAILAQTRQITGTITSAEDRLGLPGVTVMVKGSNNIATITDVNGKFTLSVPTNTETLVISFIGMKTVEVSAKQSVVSLAMESASSDLSGVVVLGYNTRPKNQITGSTVQLKSDVLKDIPTTTAMQALQGKVAGLTVSTSSGSPGAVQDIRIRGVGSLLASNEPLIVIDGIPVMNSNMSGTSAGTSLGAISSINSNDIESMTVLKDASATSAYGARGSNGVIVITTKRGRSGKTNFNLSTFTGFQNKASEGNKVLTPTQREELLAEALFNSYGASKGFTEENALTWANTQSSFAGLMSRYNTWKAAGKPENDWEKATSNENANLHNIVFTASGGNSESNFYASLGYNKTESIILGSDFKKVNGSLNYSKFLTKKIKLSTNNSVSNITQNGLILEQSAYFANPIAGKYFINPFNAPYVDGEPNQDLGSNFNYLYLKDHDKIYNNLTRVLTNSFIEWEFIKNLKYKTLVSFDYALNNYSNYSNRYHGDGASTNGYAEESDAKNFNLVAQNSLAYSFIVKEHSISTMALIEYQKNSYNYLYGYGESFATDGLTTLGSTSTNKDASTTSNDWMNASYLGMVNYAYGNKYIADFTFRREGSSRFPRGLRFGNFWSVGGAWNVSNESFFEGMKNIVNNFRVRASYGVSGNSGIDLNSYQALLAYNANYADLPAIYPSGFGNNNLSWEKNHTLDIGLDFGVFNDRISGSVSYYNKLTSDLLQNVPLSLTQGHGSITSNVGSAQNTGIEGIVNFQAIKSKDFNVNVSLNYATLHNEVTELAKDAAGKFLVIETSTRKVDVGQPFYAWYMKKYAGVDPQNGQPQWFLNGVDGDKTYDYYAAKQALTGTSAIPKYSGGGSLHIDFKGIYFDGSIYFAGGHQVFEDWAFYTHHAGSYTVGTYQGVAELMNRWQKPGDITDVPMQTYNSTAFNSSRPSTRFLYDGDYIRVKDLALGYNLPKSILSKIGYNGTASVYARGNNLFTWVKDSRLQYDPEVRADGFTRLTNPPIKSIIFGLNLNF